jgi:hypothetical protein
VLCAQWLEPDHVACERHDDEYDLERDREGHGADEPPVGEGAEAPQR